MNVDGHRHRMLTISTPGTMSNGRTVDRKFAQDQEENSRDVRPRNEELPVEKRGSFPADDCSSANVRNETQLYYCSHGR